MSHPGAAPAKRPGRAWFRAPWALFLFALVALTAAVGLARAQQPVPALSGRVIDLTGALSNEQRASLTAKLAEFEAQRGTQIVVLLVPRTAPEDIAAYAQRVADTWKIGRRDVGDGLLLVVALEERRVRIEVAKTLEGTIPDLAARRIIDEQIRPAFRSGNFAGGLEAGTAALMARIRGDAEIPAPASDAPASREGAKPGLQLEEMAVFMFFAVPILGSVLTSIFGRKLGTLGTAGAAGYGAWWFSASMAMAVLAGVAALVLVGIIGFGSKARRAGRGSRSGRGLPHIGTWGGGGWSGGGGFSSSDGGGFSSGGGGDFGGGGASGDW
jgi:uncharacterized protein